MGSIQLVLNEGGGGREKGSWLFPGFHTHDSSNPGEHLKEGLWCLASNTVSYSSYTIVQSSPHFLHLFNKHVWSVPRVRLYPRRVEYTNKQNSKSPPAHGRGGAYMLVEGIDGKRKSRLYVMTKGCGCYGKVEEAISFSSSCCWTPVLLDLSFRRWAGGHRGKSLPSYSTGGRACQPPEAFQLWKILVSIRNTTFVQRRGDWA